MYYWCAHRVLRLDIARDLNNANEQMRGRMLGCTLLAFGKSVGWVFTAKLTLDGTTMAIALASSFAARDWKKISW